MSLHGPHGTRYDELVNTPEAKSALELLAPGSEEIEFTVIVDVLRRAGIAVTAAGVTGAGVVSCSRKVRIMPDCALSEATGEFDAIVLPGGNGGATALAASKLTGERLAAQWARGGIIAAICAAPIALLQHRIALGRKITHYPGVSAELSKAYEVTGERVTVDGQLITGIGPGASFEFALALVRALAGDEAYEKVVGPLVLPATR
jgi:protein DJ-1